MSIDVQPLADHLDFGARVRGVTREALKTEAVRQQLRDTFDDRGIIVFENVERSSRMHLDLSDVFGPLKDHPLPAVARVDANAMPGVIDMVHTPDMGGIVEIDGTPLSSWLPWHFDHCYNNELNRAGVLRAIEIAPDGGRTLFADGIALYRQLSPGLREAIDGRNILYTLNLGMDDMRFGRPGNFRVIHARDSEKIYTDYAKALPRALHPAVWTRDSGEKVLHVSPWMAAGIEGAEDAEGDALLEAVCQEILALAKPYVHIWSPDDMLIWDNWRMLHAVSGMDPRQSRRMQRTTIKGDYGLGTFENGGIGDKILEMTV